MIAWYSGNIYLRNPVALFFVIVCLTVHIQLPANATQPEGACNGENLLEATVPRFELDAALGTILDHKTQLIWNACVVGQRIDNGVCVGEPSKLSWDAAVKQFKSGKNARIPTIDELASLINSPCESSALPFLTHPDHPSESAFWSSSADATVPAFARYVDFSTNRDSFTAKENKLYLRLVRSGKYTNPSGILVAEQRAVQDSKLEESRQSEISIRDANSVFSNMPDPEFCKAFGRVINGGAIDGIPLPSKVLEIAKRDAARRKLVIRADVVRGKFIKVGLSECELFALNGLPKSQRRTVTKWGDHVQYDYWGIYYYTENGRVSGWQE